MTMGCPSSADVEVGMTVRTSTLVESGKRLMKLWTCWIRAAASSVSAAVLRLRMDWVRLSRAIWVDCEVADPSEVMVTPGGSVAVTRLSLLPEFSTSEVVPDCVAEVLVMVWEKLPERSSESEV